MTDKNTMKQLRKAFDKHWDIEKQRHYLAWLEAGALPDSVPVPLNLYSFLVKDEIDGLRLLQATGLTDWTARQVLGKAYGGLLGIGDIQADLELVGVLQTIWHSGWHRHIDFTADMDAETTLRSLLNG